MSERIILSWKRWPNRRFLTLLSDHPRIVTRPPIAYEISGLSADLPKVVRGTEKGDRSIIVRQLLRIVNDHGGCIVRGVEFHALGMDIELFKEHDDNKTFDVMKHVVVHIQELFLPTEVVVVDLS